MNAILQKMLHLTKINDAPFVHPTPYKLNDKFRDSVDGEEFVIVEIVADVITVETLTGYHSSIGHNVLVGARRSYKDSISKHRHIYLGNFGKSNNAKDFWERIQ